MDEPHDEAPPPRFRRSWLGYDRRQVDAYVGQRLAKQRLAWVFDQTGSDGNRAADPRTVALEEAEREAEAILAEAKREARHILQEVEQRAHAAEQKCIKLAALRQEMAECLRQVSASTSLQARRLLAAEPTAMVEVSASSEAA